MKKKFLSIFLALCMCLSLLPTVTLAAETPTGTQLTAQTLADSDYTLSNGNYYLSDDLTIEQTIKVTGTVTLDLNGKVLMMNSATYSGTEGDGVGVIEVGSEAKLTLNDSASTAKHYVYALEGSNLWRWDAAAEEQAIQPADSNGRTYHTVTGGIITGGRNKYGGGIHVVGNSGDASKSALTMNGGNIIGCTSSCGGGVYVGGNITTTGGASTAGGTFDMNGGSIIGCAAGGQGAGVFVYDNSSFDMNGGSICDCICTQLEDGAMCRGGGVYSSGTFTMKGGSIKDCRVVSDPTLDPGATEGKSIYLTSGTLKNVVPAGYILKSGNTVVELTGKICDDNVTAVACLHTGTIGEDDKCTVCGGTCNHTLGTDGNCATCNKPLIAEVTKTTEDGTATSYLAATGVTKVDTYDVDDFDLIADAFQERSTTKIKLLADVTPTWPRAIDFILPDQTLDLNGHTFNARGSRIALCQSPDTHGIIPSLTITDSSDGKTGVLKAAEVKVAVGSLTIDSGTLTAETRTTEDGENYITTPGPIEITGASMTISGTAKVSCSAIMVEGSGSSSSARPGSLTVQGTAEITGGITVKQNGTLTMTGGTVNVLNPNELWTHESVYVVGGTAKISGGAIDYLFANSGTVELSGGTYGTVDARCDDGHVGSATNLLKNGYAYFTKESDESTDYTKLTAPQAVANTFRVQNVAVQLHECTFTTTAPYTCACGRTAAQQPIAYVDEDGNTAYCTEYTKLTSPESGPISLDADGAWYVVPDGFTALGLALDGSSHLILPNNTTATLTVGIEGASKSLTIYGQPAATGEATGKLVIGTPGIAGGIISKGDLTINGGDITVNAGVAITGAEAEHGIINGIYSVAVADKLTVNGGSLTVTTPGYANKSSVDVYCVYAGELTVNGGEVEVTGTDITGASGQVNSVGIFTRKLTMTGGDVSATGAFVEVTGSSDHDCYGSSEGVSVEPDGSGTGIASITGGKLTAKGGNVTVTDDAINVRSSSRGLYAHDLLVDGGTLEATGGNVSLTATDSGCNAWASSYGISAAMTLKSGTVTAKSGTATATGCDDTEIDVWNIYDYGGMTMQGGTVTDSVLVNLGTLTMTGGTLQLKEGSKLTSVAASPLTAPLPEGYAYFEVSRQWNEETWTYDETDVGFVTLGSQTALNPSESDSTAYYVKRCTHSEEYGTCAYCGKYLGSALTPTPSSGSSAPTYPVSDPATENGSVSVSPKNAKKGASVTITVTPDSGYTLETLTILDKNGKVIELTDNSDGTYTFKMPASAVTVKAVFAAERMENPFIDVPGGAYYENAVLWALKNGITGGIDKNHFGPDLGCTRAQLVTFLWRAVGSPVADHTIDFTDVGDSYYTEAVRWAVSLGIVGGYGNGLFGTEDTITREQMATILYRFAQAMNMDTTQGGMAVREFADYVSISDYAIEAMQWAVNAGVLQGYNNSLMPSQSCTRAQIVTMLYRLLGK